MVRQVRKAFIRALRERGFSVSDDVARSADGRIVIRMGGSEWEVKIGGIYSGNYEMAAGSMEVLKKLLRHSGEKIPNRIV